MDLIPDRSVLIAVLKFPHTERVRSLGNVVIPW